VGLIKLGKVIKTYIAKVSGSGALAQWLAVEEFAGDERKAQVFGGCNEDFAPPNGTNTIDVPLGKDRGFLASVAYRNQKITPVAIAGESRKYSTNEAGNVVMAEVFLKRSGTIVIKNAYAEIQLDRFGAITLVNDNASLKVEANGDVDVVTANGDISSFTWFGNIISTSQLGSIDLTAPILNLIGDILTTGTLKNNNVNVGSTHRHTSGSVGNPTSVPY
jgi:hypothetical protein